MDRAAFEIMPFARRGARGRDAFEFETLELEAPSGTSTLRWGSRGSTVADLQRRLASSGFSAGAADGIFGSLTDSAVRAFQRARGLGVDGIVGAQTWGALLGAAPAPSAPAPAPAPAPGPGSPGTPQVTVPSGVLISANAVRVLQGILRAAGLTRATVTSGRRTSTDQARIMYELIEGHGVAYAHDLYGSNGDQVIDAYSAAKAAGQSSTAIKSAMESKIKQLGCQNVSHHCSDSYDVFDVGPSTISDSTAFRRALDAAVASGTIKMYLSPPKDPAFHIEIALAPGSGEFEAFAEYESGFEDEFRLASLPAPVREAFGMGAIVWPMALQRAVTAGMSNLDDLTNLVFFMHHPDRVQAGIGQALNAGEPGFDKLRSEWRAFRTLIAPSLKYFAKPAPAPAPFVVTDKEKIAYQLKKLVNEREDYWSAFQPDALCVARKLLRSDADDLFIHPGRARSDKLEPSSATGLLVRRYLRKTFFIPSERCDSFETCFLKLVGEIEDGIGEVGAEYLRVHHETASAAVRESPVGKKVAFVSSQSGNARSIYHCYASWIENWFGSH